MILARKSLPSRGHQGANCVPNKCIGADFTHRSGCFFSLKSHWFQWEETTRLLSGNRVLCVCKYRTLRCDWPQPISKFQLKSLAEICWQISAEPNHIACAPQTQKKGHDVQVRCLGRLCHPSTVYKSGSKCEPSPCKTTLIYIYVRCKYPFLFFLLMTTYLQFSAA